MVPVNPPGTRSFHIPAKQNLVNLTAGLPSLMGILAIGYLGGCSTAPPNLAHALLTPDSLAYVFIGIDYASNMGHLTLDVEETDPYIDDDRKFNHTYEIVNDADTYALVPMPWALFSLFLNGQQPAAVLGVHVAQWSSIAWIPTWSLVDKDWYHAVQFNQKLFPYVAISVSRYREQMLHKKSFDEVGFGFGYHVRRVTLNEVALTICVPFKLQRRHLAYSLVPKYTWSDDMQIEGGGLSAVLGFSFGDPADRPR